MGRYSIGERDMRRMRRLAHPREWLDGSGAPEGPAMAMLAELVALIPCEQVSFGVVDSARRTFPGPDFELPAVGPASGQPAEEVFFRHYWEMPACCYPDRTGDLDRLLLSSDFYSLRQFRETGLYKDYIEGTGFRRYLVACVAGRPGRTLRLTFWRGAGPDFSDRDQTVLDLIRPHTVPFYRLASAVRAEEPATGLTPRQTQLLHLVADGLTNGQIARRMGIAEATVRKHLEHVFARLQVSSRAAAVARGLPDDRTV